MRKLISRAERERKERRGKVFFGMVMVGLMLLSTLGYAIQSNLGSNKGSQTDSLVKYNGYEFSNVNGLWVMNNFVFKYNPKEVSENIGSNFKTFESYQSKPLYLQTEDDLAGVEIYVNMAQIAERVTPACLSGTTCAENVPIKTCNDNFIVIKEASVNTVRQENNCVYIEGKKEDLVKLTDEFLFKIMGIK